MIDFPQWRKSIEVREYLSPLVFLLFLLQLSVALIIHSSFWVVSPYFPLRALTGLLRPHRACESFEIWGSLTRFRKQISGITFLSRAIVCIIVNLNLLIHKAKNSLLLSKEWNSQDMIVLIDVCYIKVDLGSFIISKFDVRFIIINDFWLAAYAA